MPFFIAFVIAYFIHPLTYRLSKAFGHKTLIISIIIGVLVCLSIVFISLIIPRVYQQTTILVSQIPAYKSYLQPLIVDKISHLSPEIAIRLNDVLHELFSSIITLIANSMNNIFIYCLATASTLVMILIVPILLFYFLRDFTSYRNIIEQSLPNTIRAKAHKALDDINSLLSAYAKGQLKVCVILAIYYSIGLITIGLDLGLLLGIISGFSIILPFVGFISSCSVAMVLSYLGFGLSYHLLAVVVLYLLGGIFESSTLTPKIIGGKIGLHPLWIIFSVLAGASLLGVLGMFLAIPLAGIIKILFKKCRIIFTFIGAKSTK